MRCNPGNTKLCLSSLSTLSLAQIISSSSLESISLLRGGCINQRLHMSLTDPGSVACLQSYFIVLFLDVFNDALLCFITDSK